MKKNEAACLRRCGAGCGNFIDIHKPLTFRTINHRKVCMTCSALKKPLLVGSKSFYPSPLAAARFATRCSLDRGPKHKARSESL